MSAKTTKAKLPSSYEEGVKELEQLLASIESGQLPLEQLLEGYQRGAQLLAFCRSRLQAVEDQIQVLDESGSSQSLDSMGVRSTAK